MPSNLLNYTPSLKSVSVAPKKVQLFIPPIRWRGDPKGHIGVYDTFFYVANGECFLMIDGEYTILKAGDLAFLPRGKMRAYSNMSETISLYEMNFSSEINGEIWHEVLGLNQAPYAVRVENDTEIKELFESSVRYEVNRSILYDIIHSANLLSLIRIFATEKARKAEKSEPFISVIEYMKNNLSSSIKIAELAEAAFMEETYFIKKFKKALGDSPITYLNKLKIYKAMHHLAESELTLSEISHSVGIYDSSYFSKLFKSFCGVTPGEYRNIFK